MKQHVEWVNQGVRKENKIQFFNWYQIVRFTPTKNTVKPPRGVTFGKWMIDPAAGQQIDGAWADNLPWYWDVTQPPKGKERKGSQLTDHIDDKKGTLTFYDRPEPGPCLKAEFRTWLVGVNEDTKRILWIQGFTWDVVGEPGQRADDVQYKLSYGGRLDRVPQAEEFPDLMKTFGR